MIKVTPDAIMAGTGCTSTLANAYLELLIGAMAKYSINTPRRVAAFLANVGEETGGLSKARENLNYSAQGLANTWPSRYSSTGSAPPRTPNALAVSLNRRPEAIANNVYANRLGNGNEASGDGWKYRGVGWIQTTGAENIKKALTAIGLPANSDPSVLEQPAYAALSAAYYWQSRGCNELADKDMFSATVKEVNGAVPNPANRGPQRLANYRACVAKLNDLNK